MSTLEPPYTTLVCRLGHLVIDVAIIDCNGCASANRNPDYTSIGKGTNIVNSAR